MLNVFLNPILVFQTKHLQWHLKNIHKFCIRIFLLLYTILFQYYTISTIERY